MKLLTKSVPSYFLLIALVVGALISYSFTTSLANKKENDVSSLPISNSDATNNAPCQITINRLSGRKYIKPLLFVEKNCEAETFVTIKKNVSAAIENLKKTGDINSASVYVRLFKHGEWMGINEDITYQPGSLFKVPVLITYLRMSEKNSELLNKKYAFAKVTQESKSLKQEFVKNKIQIGKSYSIKELLRYMIVHSDNDATMLLLNNLPMTEFEKTFTDLGMSKELTKNEARISPKNYASFWLVLYNGSYLNFDNSDYALGLLSETDFSDGIVKGVPPNIKVAHKFGEKGDQTNHGFHETGIVYANNTPYLITVMTEGSHQEKLPAALQKISAEVYKNIEIFTH